MKKLLCSLLFVLGLSLAHAQNVPGKYRLSGGLSSIFAFDSHQLNHISIISGQTQQLMFSPAGGSGLWLEGGAFINERFMLSAVMLPHLVWVTQTEITNGGDRTTRAVGGRFEFGFLPSLHIDSDFGSSIQHHYVSVGPFFSTLPSLEIEENSLYEMIASQSFSLHYMVRYSLDYQLSEGFYLGGTLAYRGGAMPMEVEYNQARYQSDPIYRNDFVDPLKAGLEEQKMNGLLIAFHASTYF